MLWKPRLHGIVCLRGSAIATTLAALLEICEDPAPELQCWDVAMCLLTYLYLKKNQAVVLGTIWGIMYLGYR